MRRIQPGNIVCLPWGRGVGKSWFLRLVWWTLVARWDGKHRPGACKPGVRIVLLMPTLEQAKKVHAKEMLDELEGDWSFLGGTVNRSEWRVSFPGGSWIQWVTSERAKGARGIRCDLVSIDECDDVPAEVADAVVVPWFSEHHSLAIQVYAGTPTKGRQGLLYRTHQRGVKGEPNHYSFHATYRDAPETVDPAKVELARQMPPEYFSREWECNFDSAEGLVYPMFSEPFHVRAPHPQTRWTEVIIGCDWGYEDPGVFLAIGIAGSGRDSTAHVLEELYRQHETESFWISTARAWATKYPNARWYGDPSMPARIEALRRDARLRIVGAENAIEEGVASVSDWLLPRERQNVERWARLYIHPSCKNTIRELGLYRRRRDARDRDRILDAIEDRNNHAMDALRYALFSRFGSPERTRVEEGSGW